MSQRWRLGRHILRSVLASPSSLLFAVKTSSVRREGAIKFSLGASVQDCIDLF